MAVNLAVGSTRSKTTEKSWDMRTPAILKSYRKSICPVTAAQASKPWRLDTGSTWIMGMKLLLGNFSWRTSVTKLSICLFRCLRTMPLTSVWTLPKSSYVTSYGLLKRCMQIYSHWRCTILEVYTKFVTVTLKRVCRFDFMKKKIFYATRFVDNTCSILSSDISDMYIKHIRTSRKLSAI